MCQVKAFAAKLSFLQLSIYDKGCSSGKTAINSTVAIDNSGLTVAVSTPNKIHQDQVAG